MHRDKFCIRLIVILPLHCGSSICVLISMFMDQNVNHIVLHYGDGADSTVEENSSIFSLIQVR